ELTDSLIFFPLAFSFVMPWEEMPSLIVTQVVIKTLYEVVALPVTYRVVAYTKRHDDEDVYDHNISYNIFKIKKL
ncbi:MAG: VUT family protein, partial [Prevotella sp.]|nr:VUT family protein [Prevotella sp.]